LSTYEGFGAFMGAFCHPRHFFAAGYRSPLPFVLEGTSTRTGRKERSMSREKNVFEKFPKKGPKGPFGKPVRGKRRNHGLPSGVKGGETLPA
jgi:hypothetical protein